VRIEGESARADERKRERERERERELASERGMDEHVCLGVNVCRVYAAV